MAAISQVKWIFHEEGEEELQLSAAIELEAGGNSAGSYGPLNFSAEIKAETGISWMKTVKTQYAHDTTIDETKLYVPIPIRAKLMSDVISAYNTSFALFLGAWGVTVNTGGVASDDYRLDRHQDQINNGISKK
ncbi:uncharacterized protein BDW43DRAFT_311274 [Aspergillus alliaceus]|uniref:uncharacterized protein n=1 Tax=Petromyces alliaceus TaxID=209559 RepID=UPI0012A4507F|nr:uncharacterized protein BDW43DRAFT_311274 [Aspergillus alliaceus]KAB8233200.1 hypothetical protein BDW43DRAFT_311274 [Aspergillus alliaceus]